MQRHTTVRSISLHGVVLAWLVGAGCASAPEAKPEGDLSAEEHRQAAAEHEARAAEHADRYDPVAEEHKFPTVGIDLGTYNPTEAHLLHAQEHKEHAADHEAVARALENFEDAECGRFPPETRRMCPLMGKVVGVQDLGGGPKGGRDAKSGIRIRFADDVNREAVIAHMRCHLAFAQTQGRKGMDHCPLYVEGVSIAAGQSSTEVQVEAGGEGNTVDLLVQDEALLEELRRRAKAHMPGSK